MLKIIIHVAFLLMVLSLGAQTTKNDFIEKLDHTANSYNKIASQIWNFAEMGYLEEKSSALLQQTLEDNGFKIEKGVAGIPTAFIAEYGNGFPVIGILGEYDALPGLSQKALPTKESAGKEAGHACGHHLFGTASAAAAISTKEWMEKNNIKGTIRFYGTPAEEGGSGKVYMVREGLFDDVDIVLHWHPSDSNSANAGAALANKSAKFRFHGISAHAASAPERGRSALDAVEAMNFMINMMREHIPDDARIHYVITDGGKAPNVVPDFAEVYYYARHEDRSIVIDLFNRMKKAAEGAALGTGTTYDYEMIGGTHDLLPNITLQKIMYDNLKGIGGITYNQQEKEFANEMAESLGREEIDFNAAKKIQEFKTESRAYASTDVGDVSYAVPTAGIYTATWVPGSAGHSWQAVAAGGTSIGEKGMMVAAKTMSLTAMNLFEDTNLIKEAKKEFLKRRGKYFEYIPLLGNREPALDYRK